MTHTEYTPLSDENISWRKDYRDYLVKTIDSGPMRELIIYPVWDTKSKSRAKKEKLSTEAQEKYNQKKLQQKTARLINTNFEENKDLWVDLTYADNISYEQAEKEIKNYTQRLKNYCKKNNLPELKYIFTTEYGEKSGRVHHHFITNFRDMQVLNEMWSSKSERCKKRKNPYYTIKLLGRLRIRTLVGDDFGLLAAGNYIAKAGEKSKGYPRNKKKVHYSKNLKQPKERISRTIKGRKLSLRKIKEFAWDSEEFKKYVQRLYPDFHISNASGKKGEFCGYYLYAVMRKYDKEETEKRLC